MTAIRGLALREVVRPLRVTFSTSLGSKSFIHSIVAKIILEDGTWGAGECPTSFALKQETIPAIKGVLRDITPSLKGLPIEEWEQAIPRLRTTYALFPMTISGLEVALFRAYLACRGTTGHAYWGEKAHILETDITIPFIPDMTLLEPWLRYAVNRGFTMYKVKVSGDVETDRRFITSVHSFLKERLPEFTIRLDGNQGFAENTCLSFMAFLERAGITVELFEQPLPKDDFKGLAAVSKLSPIPIILDETVFTAEDAGRVLDEGLGHGVNIKVAKSGITGSREIVRLCREQELRLMVGCMTETMTGLSAGIELAAGSGAFEYVDLDSIFFLHHKKQYGNIAIQGPQFLLGETPVRLPHGGQYPLSGQES